jgi:hypothetical protein
MCCAGWLEQLAGGGYPPVINLRPDSDWPDTDNVSVDQARVVRILRRITHVGGRGRGSTARAATPAR